MYAKNETFNLRKGDMVMAKNHGGRPLKFKTPEELEKRIEEYFEYAKENKEVPTVSGLAWYLDTNRQC